jgi:hypothetical protein
VLEFVKGFAIGIWKRVRSVVRLGLNVCLWVVVLLFKEPLLAALLSAIKGFELIFKKVTLGFSIYSQDLGFINLARKSLFRLFSDLSVRRPLILRTFREMRLNMVTTVF